MALTDTEFVCRVQQLLGKEFPALTDRKLSLADVKAFRLKLGDLMLGAVQDACEHGETEWIDGIVRSYESCRMCGKELKP